MILLQIAEDKSMEFALRFGDQRPPGGRMTIMSHCDLGDGSFNEGRKAKSRRKGRREVQNVEYVHNGKVIVKKKETTKTNDTLCGKLRYLKSNFCW